MNKFAVFVLLTVLLSLPFTASADVLDPPGLFGFPIETLIVQTKSGLDCQFVFANDDGHIVTH